MGHSDGMNEHLSDREQQIARMSLEHGLVAAADMADKISAELGLLGKAEAAGALKAFAAAVRTTNIKTFTPDGRT